MNAFVTSLNDLSEEQLVVLAREKNEEAFTLLVTRCLGMLKSLSAKYCRDFSESEDLVQEGLLGLLSAVQTYHSSNKVSFRTYAYACARNRMVSALRRRNGAPMQSLDEEDELSDFIGDTDPASLLVQQEETENLDKRLRDKLSSLEYRVLMARLSGYSYGEIAMCLNVTEKTVDNAYQRLRRKLAPALI